MGHLRSETAGGRVARRRALWAAVIFIGVCALGVGSVRAEDGPPAWAYQLPHDLMSPYCPGRTLAECPSPSADELRLWILTQAAAGAERDEVEKMLFQRFGDVIRSAPRAEGWGISAYAIPIVGFLVGGGLVAVFLRRFVKSSPATLEPSDLAHASVDPELERLVDEELGRD